MALRVPLSILLDSEEPHTLGASDSFRTGLRLSAIPMHTLGFHDRPERPMALILSSGRGTRRVIPLKARPRTTVVVPWKVTETNPPPAVFSDVSDVPCQFRQRGEQRPEQRGGTQVYAGSPESAPLEARREERLIRLLAAELPRQYEADLTWDCYDDSVIFADPVTLIKGKLPYRGMILSLRLLAAAAFQQSTAEFILHSIEPVAPSFRTLARYSPRVYDQQGVFSCAIRTVWATCGVTKWGKSFKISGDDIFRVNSLGKIVAHESAWNESPSEVWESFCP